MKETVTIRILGDICPDWGFREEFDRQNTAAIFGDVLPELRAADIAVANLEAPLAASGTPICKTGPNLHGKPEDFSVLSQAGLTAVALANNHILDYGVDALRETISAARDAGVLTFGAGENCNEAEKPLILETKGRKVGFLCFCEAEFSFTDGDFPGANLFDPYRSLSDIAGLKQQVDYLVVLYHGGIEHYRYPSPLLQKKCRAIAKAGADLVICQHSHCIGTAENYDGTTILYGQGNAIFGRRKTDQWNQGLLVDIVLSEDTPAVHYRVFEAGQHGISFVPQEIQKQVLGRMEAESACLCDADAIKSKWDDFCKKQESEYFPALYGWGRVMNKLNRMLKNRLFRLRYSRWKKLVTMNLIRCDAHREVVQTILENTQKQG